MNYENLDAKYFKKLKNLGILPSQDQSTCGNTQLTIQNLKYNKSNKVCFRCLKKTYKLRHPITTNSFFDNFKYLNVAICIEIIKANICLRFNINKTQKYLSQEKNINVWDKIIRKDFIK